MLFLVSRIIFTWALHLFTRTWYSYGTQPMFTLLKGGLIQIHTAELILFDVGNKCFMKWKVFKTHLPWSTTEYIQRYTWRIWTKKYKNLSNKILRMLKLSNFQIRNKTKNINTVILLIGFLVYQWDPRHLQGSDFVYVFVGVPFSVNQSLLSFICW